MGVVMVPADGVRVRFYSTLSLNVSECEYPY